MNFDPQVQELMKETIYFKKMNLEIPEEAKNLILLEPKIEGYVEGYCFFFQVKITIQTVF